MNKDVISISLENTKMGPIPSFSLPPLVSCNLSAPCIKGGCFAVNMMRRRKNIKTAWERNWRIVSTNPDEFVRQVLGWLAIYQPVAFRIHVGGDFFCSEYLDLWCHIARKNPCVRFFAFTKQWDSVRKAKSIPKNFSIILSAWTPDKNNWCPPEDLMKKYPVAWLAKTHPGKGGTDQLDMIYHITHDCAIGNHRYEKISHCEGHCATCGKCFKLKKKDGDILLEYH